MYLCGWRPEVFHVDREKEVSVAKPSFEKLQDFRDTYKDDKVTQERLRNKVKKCANCGKPCAFTLADCNACGASLKDVDVSYTDNVFMGFVFGIGGNDRFPFKISIRHQSPDFLCFDDPLSMSTCHLNCIPTTVYCPDCRYLFRNPKEGLRLIDGMFRVAAEVAMKQFWGNTAHRNTFLTGATPPASVEEVLSVVMAGMNCPPSQYQLHLQFIHAPLLPFHYAQALEYRHFHYGRFFPFEYMRAALALGDQVRMDIKEDTDMNDIVNHVRSLGVNYDEYQTRLQSKFRELQQRFACWKEEDFDGQCINGKFFPFKDCGKEGDADPKQIQAEDTQKLQNYGRPYGADGKFTGIFYGYPKKPEDIQGFA
jgi:hypothetical protein